MMKKKGNIPRYDLVVPLSYLVLRKILRGVQFIVTVVYCVYGECDDVVYLVYSMVLLVGWSFAFSFFFCLVDL